MKLTNKQLIREALRRDWGPEGDVTSRAVIGARQKAAAILVVKSKEGVASGLKVFKAVFAVIDPKIKVELKTADGEMVKAGEVMAVVEGQAGKILAGERVALEFVRRMSGIASKTREFVEAVAGKRVTILDTRKTLPIWGELDKQAVRDGGGSNHRTNLSQMGLIKNNHIDLSGGDIGKTVRRFRNKYPEIALEVEVRNERELLEALGQQPERVMLDNMTDGQIIRAVEIRDDWAEKTGVATALEASGNMMLERVKKIADCGVEYVSVGALTHSVTPLDISLHIQTSR